MSYLEYFHFDNSPFPTDGSVHYLYPRYSQFKLVEDISNLCRFYAGIYMIVGSKGCGKSILLSYLALKLSNNEFVIDIKSSNSSDLLKSIANSLNVKNHKNIDDVLNALYRIHSHGQNIILIIDDADCLSKEQFINLNSLTDVAKYLRVVLVSNRNPRKLFSNRAVLPLRKNIIKLYKLKYLSYLEGVNYISYINKSALALSQYKKTMTFPAILFLSFISNRNINNINIVSTDALKKAFDEKAPCVNLSHVFKVAKENFDLVRTNIYQKFQKIFIGILFLLTLFFTIKIIFDRYDTITTLEARQSIARQEAALRS